MDDKNLLVPRSYSLNYGMERRKRLYQRLIEKPHLVLARGFEGRVALNWTLTMPLMRPMPRLRRPGTISQWTTSINIAKPLVLEYLFTISRDSSSFTLIPWTSET